MSEILDPRDGGYFPIDDLQAATAWARGRPEILLFVASDHERVPEVIEIKHRGAEQARWMIWRDADGALHLDDWLRQRFDIACADTVAKACMHIERELREMPT